MAVSLLLSACAFLQGCSTLGNSSSARSDRLGETVSSVPERKASSAQDKKDELVAIANSPAAMLPPSTPEPPKKRPPAPAPTSSPAPSESSSGIFKKEAEISLKKAKTVGLNPDRIHIGDIFKGQEGMALRKVVSFSDSLHVTAPAVEASLLKNVSSVRSAKVPLTISQKELAALKKKAKSGVSLPTRSVALDFDSTIHRAKMSDLESVLAKMSSGKISGLEGNEETKDLLRSRLIEAKKRISAGDTLYVVTKVTRSSTALASYPGAPLGQRDVKRIKNAVAAMFPQFTSLEAKKKDDKVILTQPGGMTWTFEASPLKVKAGRLRIDPAGAHTF